MRIYGHRGCRGKPGISENSIAAFRAAMEGGADGIELDVFSTTDNQLVVFHDETLDALSSGTGPITSHSLAALQALKLRERAGSEVFTEDKIPTLDAVLDAVREFRAAHRDEPRARKFKVCIEIKDAQCAGKVADAVERCLADGTAGWSLDNFEVRSFEMESLRAMKQRMPQIQLGVLFAGPEYPWDVSEAMLKELLAQNNDLFDETAKTAPNNTVSITLASLTDGALRIIRDTIGNGADGRLRITPWTAGEVNPLSRPAEGQKALVDTLARTVGADGAFITDFPAEMAQLAAQHGVAMPGRRRPSSTEHSPGR
ncbi:MAG: hypothetical protein IT567_02275 [Alphaproteobacteria bacterium]|nr:hypothetical protein [Alphaproteobacteria bacterium]